MLRDKILEYLISKQKSFNILILRNQFQLIEELKFKTFNIQMENHCSALNSFYLNSHEPCACKCILYVPMYMVVVLHLYDYFIKLFYCTFGESERERR